MIIKDYPNNNIVHKNEATNNKKKIEPVAKGHIKEKSFVDGLIEDDLKTAGSNLLKEVIGPGIIRFVSDTLHAAVDAVLFPDSYGSGGRTTKKGTWVSYNEYSSRPKQKTRIRREESSNSVENVELDSRMEAESVIDTMMDICQLYPSCSVADYLELVGITGDYTDNDYGWDINDLKSAYVVRGRNGKYIVKLPKPHPLA